MAILNLVVIANNDELRYVGNGFGPTGTLQVAPPVLRAGYFAPTAKWEGVGMRFQSVTIPQGATIVTAKLTFTCDTTFTMANCNTEISAQDADNPSDFTGETWASLKARWEGRTTAQIDWDNIEAWTAESTYNSPDIKTVIQEIVDRSGWTSGNSIVIFWDDWTHDSGGSQKTRSAYPYNISHAKAVRLVITYNPPAGVFRPFFKEVLGY